MLTCFKLDIGCSVAFHSHTLLAVINTYDCCYGQKVPMVSQLHNFLTIQDTIIHDASFKSTWNIL